MPNNILYSSSIRNQHIVSGLMDPVKILRFLDTDLEDVILAKFWVRSKSLRYQVFRRQLECSNPECYRKITFCLLQTRRHSPLKRAHVNFFSKDGVLFTKDHIKPKCLGGSDRLSNLQTMCLECNEKKGSHYRQK